MGAPNRNGFRENRTGPTTSYDCQPTTHKRGEIEGFTKRYKINRLVYFERYQYIGNAIRREKQIKGLDRVKRVALIERDNPTWEDLAAEWGKRIEPLTPVADATKPDPSLRS